MSSKKIWEEGAGVRSMVLHEKQEEAAQPAAPGGPTLTFQTVVGLQAPYQHDAHCGPAAFT